MPVRQLLTGPDLAALEEVALARAAGELEDPGVDDVLLVTRDGGRLDDLEARWREYGSGLTLRGVTIDTLATEYHELAAHRTAETHMGGGTRDRLVEAAVARLSGTDNPLAVDGLPSRGLCDQAYNLLTLMEFADLQSAGAIRERLRAEGLPRQARVVAALQETFGEVRAAHDERREGPPLSIRGERYSHLVNEVPDLGALGGPDPEVVVLTGFTLLSPLERRFVARLVDTWPTIAVLPTMHPGAPERGVDTAIDRVLEAYEEMGLDREHLDPDTDTDADADADGSGPDAAARLFARDDREQPGDGPPTPAALDRYTASSRPAELRHVARSIRADLQEGYAPSEIGVVLSSSDVYGTLATTVLDQYDVPHTAAIDEGVLETAVGGAIAETIQLVTSGAPTSSLIGLLANPLVAPWPDRETDPVVGQLRDVDGRLDSDALARALAELSPEPRARLEGLLERLDGLTAVEPETLDAAVDRLLETLGVPDRLETLDPGSRRARVERAAHAAVRRTAGELAATAPLDEATVQTEEGPALARLDRALRGTVVEAPPARETERVVVTDLGSVGLDSFERLYLVGQTAGDVPTNPDRLAFTRPINEAHPDFATADTQARARYHAAVLMAAASAVTVTAAERDLDGAPLLESELCAELERVAGLDPSPSTPEPATQEDVQREIAARTATDEGRRDAVTAAREAGTVDDSTAHRALAGAALAAARACPRPTEYDGWLSAETRRALHDPETHAPTGLETYAACGFRYLMGEALELPEPDRLTAEASALERGSYVHAVLERFYRAAVQDGRGDPVTDPVDAGPRWQGRLLEVALEELDDALSADPTAFQRGWLEDVLAGLGPPEMNPYHDRSHAATGTDAEADVDDEGPAPRGLLVRFLEEEASLRDVTVAPTWFEARIGPERPHDTTVLSSAPARIETPGGTVALTGTVDRIDTVETHHGTELVVRDYKTGRTPSEAATLDGLRLQLPVYALLAESVLDDEGHPDGTPPAETVGGAYYRVSPPTGVRHNRGQIGSEQRTAHARSGEEQPLRAWRYPRFDDHASFRRFLETEVPRRLGTITEGIAAGSFHPTILDPADAGCRHCGYSHVCDVRSHRRFETMDHLQAAERPAYVPPVARGEHHDPPAETEADGGAVDGGGGDG